MSIVYSLLPVGIFFGLGFLTQIGEARWPLRRYVKPKALRLDLIGFAVTLLARGLVEKFQEPAIARLPSVPGLEWMATVARVVEWKVRWPIALLVSVVVLDFMLGVDARLNGSNFGFLLTVWDRMFGTYVSPDRVPADFPLGLNYRVAAARMWIGLPPGRPT